MEPTSEESIGKSKFEELGVASSFEFFGWLLKAHTANGDYFGNYLAPKSIKQRAEL
jgi:hypothetical protein